MPEPVLHVSDLVAGYGRQPVLHGLSLHVDPAEVLGLIGPNGHGKTTLFRAISGLIPAWQGAVRFLGEDITGLRTPLIAERGLVHVPQGNHLYPDMTVLENLHLGAYAPRPRKEWRNTLEQVFALFPRLAERKSQRCRTLSGGERQMVAIGCGLMGQPKLLILDEPTLGLSPRLKGELRDAIGEIIASGVQLIIVEQDPEFLRRLTTRQVFVEEGLTRDDFVSGSLEHGKIMEMYFGMD
ncbi:ABC transporter ATP-binding protein [Roseovarius aestuarii]|nr:ABC transporter ATP-binding protein [Roseovarius aestuarii]